MKTVAINAMALVQDRPIGIERYARNVIGRLDLGKHLVWCFTRRGVSLADRLGAGFVQRHPNLKQTFIATGSTTTRILIEMFLLSWVARKVDVILSINNFGPLWGKPTQRRMVVIHDVWFMSNYFEGRAVERCIFRILVSLQIRRAHRIITVSEFSKREILRHFNLQDSKIVVVKNCLARPESNLKGLPKSDGVDLLLMGSERKNKNVYRSICGFRDYVRSSKRHEIRLVVTGRYGSTFIDQIRDDFQDCWHHISFSGHVSDEELDRLYYRCDAVLFVSLYEGYGLPAIEAVLRGKPAIVSRDTACAEELGALAIAVNGLDPQAIAKGIGIALARNVDRSSAEYHAFASRQYDCDAQVGKLKSQLVAFDD